MNIEISDNTAERIVSRLQAFGITSGDKARSIQLVLEMLADSTNGLSFRQIADRLKPGKDGPEESALEVAERLGLVGTFEGPSDLSTNPAHMQGFGQ